MAPEEKPYRVYKGGRVKGKVPTTRRGAPTPQPRKSARTGDGKRIRFRGPGALRAFLPKRPPWRRILIFGPLLLLVLFVVWTIASYFALSSGVSDANKRLAPGARAVLAKQSGLLLSHATNILVLGTDNAPLPGRSGDNHSDSIMVVRSDPGHHRIAYLSIPRDIVVPIPGVGNAKINFAMQSGGIPLAIRVVHDLTGLPINHVIEVDFAQFTGLVDALGGITVVVPDAVRSNRFDCPYATAARCQQWQGWYFRKGPQHMNGKQALIYSRIRENLLNPRESTDFFRASRQQAVTQAVLSKFTSFGTLLGAPFNATSWVKPITTDLSTSQLIELGWVKFRSSTGNALHCRLGADLGAGGTGAPSQDNALAILMFLGRSAPQLPTSTFGPGCARGHTLS
jgi:polyisoprenyl-teichoic acid--peptidoglycan teichoic acid transferase